MNASATAEPEARIEAWSRLVTRVLAPNPGPMTLDGTNTLIVRDPGSHGVVVVDPGPADPLHQRRLQSLGHIDLILLTHHHLDHAESAVRLHRVTGAPVRAADSAHCHGALPLRDGETIDVAGCRIETITTPGHTVDSVCFRLLGDRAEDEHSADGSVLTGDMILGRGTTVIAHPTGSVRDYLASLERLRRLGGVPAFPGHGPRIPRLDYMCELLTRHRLERLEEIRAVLAKRGMRPTEARAVEVVVDEVYRIDDLVMHRAAGMSAVAQLQYLATEG